MQIETDWQSFTALPYAEGERVSCGNCGSPLPIVTRWRVLTEISSPMLLEALAAGTVNEFSCTQCGMVGDFGEPVLFLDRVRNRSILLYKLTAAPEAEAETRENIFALLEKIPGANLSSLRENSLTAESPEDFVLSRDASTEDFTRILDAAHRRDNRRGVFGADRVALICRDTVAVGILLTDRFETSEELLGNAEFWVGTAATEIRVQLTGSFTESGPAGSARGPDLIQEVFAELRAGYSQIHGELDAMATVRSVALLTSFGQGLESKERERLEQRTGPLHSILGALQTFLDATRNNARQKIFAADSHEPRQARQLTNIASAVAGTPQAEFTWDGSYLITPADELLEIGRALNDGRRGEAYERAVEWEHRCQPEFLRTAALMRAAAALNCGYFHGIALADRAIDATYAEVKRSRLVEENEFTAMGVTFRCRANFYSSKGFDQDSLNDKLTALALFCAVGDPSMIATIAFESFEHLLLAGKNEEALEVSKVITESQNVLSRLSERESIAMSRNLSLLKRPWLEISYFADTKKVRILNRHNIHVAEREKVGWIGGPATLSPDDQKELAQSTMSTGVILEMRSPMDGGVELCLTSFIGNAGLADLYKRLESAVTLRDRFILLLNIAQVEQPYTATTPGDERLLGVGAAVTAEEIVRLILAITENGYDPELLHDVAAACAFVCTTYVSTAQRAEHLFVANGKKENEIWLAGYAEQLWNQAVHTGRASLSLVRLLGERRLAAGVLSDDSSISDMILRSYPLALETTGAIDEAIDAYTFLMPRREQRRSSYLDKGLVRWAQIQMTRPYARFSRCLFARFRATGNFEDVIWSADLLERHRARSMQAKGISLTHADISKWTSSPLRTAAALLDESDALVSLGWHPMGERIAGRWMAVGLGGGNGAANWVTETTPPTRLQKIHHWFSGRMQEVSRTARTSSIPEYLEALNRLLPHDEVMAVLIDLWAALAVPEGSFTHIHLSAEDYALQLPWSAAANTSTASPALDVSVTPTTAIIGRPIWSRITENAHIVISTSWPDEGFQLADAIDARRPADARPVEVHDQSSRDGVLGADVLILLSHGSRGSGLSGFYDTLSVSGTAVPRTILLLGCWSAHIDQDLSDRDVQGLAVSLLAAGAEIVVASLWTVAFPIGVIFISSFLGAISHGSLPLAAFAVARDEVRAAYPHPAIWSGFTVFG